MCSIYNCSNIAIDNAVVLHILYTLYILYAAAVGGYLLSTVMLFWVRFSWSALMWTFPFIVAKGSLAVLLWCKKSHFSKKLKQIQWRCFDRCQLNLSSERSYCIRRDGTAGFDSFCLIDLYLQDSFCQFCKVSFFSRYSDLNESKIGIVGISRIDNMHSGDICCHLHL